MSHKKDNLLMQVDDNLNTFQKFKLSDSKKNLLEKIRISNTKDGQEIIFKNNKIVKNKFVEVSHNRYFYVYDLQKKTYCKIRKSEEPKTKE